MRRTVLRIFLPMLLLAVLLIMAGCANRVPRLPVPPGVSKHTEKLMLQGKSVPVDFYLPQQVGEAPVVIVAHGFTRHRRVMAGWGNLLATQGMITVVPNLPAFADHERNARAISELIALVHEPRRLVKAKPSGAVALVGHSAGGFATLLAASREKDVRCWIGLDPVDFGDHGLRAVQALKTPALMLLAESGAWNRHANALPWLNASASPLIALRVRGSTHCNAENPTSRLAEIACGTTDATRRAVYERHTLAMLRQHLFGDVTATRALAHDPDVVPLPSRRADSTAKVE
jgi:dienelactone hydrolase